MLPIKKILCPTDFSEPSYEAVNAANKFAIHFNAELILIHVLSSVPVYPDSVMFMGDPIDPAVHDDREEFAKKLLIITMQEKIPQEVRAQSVLLNGSAPDEIIKHAESEETDLIVIGTHGLTGWRRLIFGSVAEKVVRLASCPVLTIPATPENDDL
ncbi:universal stress protein [Thermodesulfobacteriota bacterium]